MRRRAQENPQLDMTPMIDVVFELIIFFVVTLTEAQKRDETIELEDGKHGIVLTPEELPPTHMQIDIASCDKRGKYLPNGRITMGDREISKAEITRRVKERMRKLGGEFPVLIRADFNCRHDAVRRVMDACTEAGLWKISFMAVGEDKTYKNDAGIHAKLKQMREGHLAKGGPRARLLSKFPNQKPPKKGGR